MKRATIAVLLFGCSLAPSIAGARGMYCSRHREECNQREEDRKAAQAAADAAHAKWYAALSPIDKAKEDGRVEGTTAEADYWTKVFRDSEAENAGEVARLNNEASSAAWWLPIYILLSAVFGLLLGVFLGSALKDDGQ